MTAQPIQAVDPSTEDVPAAEVPPEDEWIVPAAWRRHVHPVRGLDDVPPPQRDAQAYDDLLAAHAGAVRARVADPSTEEALRRTGLGALGERTGLLRRLKPPTPLGLATVAGALVCELRGNAVEQAADAAVDAWWERHDVDTVVCATLALSVLRVRTVFAETGMKRTAVAGRSHHPAQRAALVRLRRLLASSDDATYARALAALERAVLTDTDEGLALAAYLAPTRADWVSAAVERTAPTLGGSLLWTMLLTSVRTLPEAQTVWRSAYRWHLQTDASLVTTLVAHLGPDCASLLVPELGEDASSDTRRRTALLLAALPSDEAWAALLAAVDRKAVAEAVLSSKERQPFRTARLLAEASVAGAPTAGTCAKLLTTHLSAHPGTAAVAHLLTPPARAALSRALPREDTRPVATPDSLPPVLAQAPWERRRGGPRPVVVPGLVASVPATVVWEDGEQERWRRQPRQYMTNGRDWDTALASATWRRIYLLGAAPREIGRRHLAVEPGRDTMHCEPQDSRALLAQQEADAVPLLLALARQSASHAPALLPVASVEVAQAMAEWLPRKALRPTALAWFARHPRVAALALVPQALGKAGEDRRAAERALRLLAGRDRAVVEEAAESYGPEAVAGVTAMLAIDPLDVLPARPPALPRWLDVPSLPAVLLADRRTRLPSDAVARLLTCLALSQPWEPYAGVEQALPHLDPTSVAEWAWAVLEVWRAAGAPAASGWVLAAQALVGDDGTARRLAPLIAAWPKQGGMAKAVTGLDVLAGIGTDVALMHLHRLATRAPSTSLRERAAARVARVADERGLTTDELRDRLVPDLGLDPDGRTVLDYGPRAFVVGFDEGLKPYVEEQGRRRAALPKPGAKDDPELAAASYARFAGLKKDARTVAGDQVRRLEQSMAAQRRWTAEEQRRLFVDHPLLWHLTRRLVWAEYDGDGRAVRSFRVAEDRTLADRDDLELALPGTATVGIAHPLHLGDDVGTWTEVFADYELLQPFPQLGREVLRLTDEERPQTSLTRFADAGVETTRVFGLSSRGWQLSQPEDSGVRSRLEKPLPGGLLGVVDLEPGIYAGSALGVPEQRFVRVRVVREQDGPWRTEGVVLGSLDDVTASELLRDLSRAAVPA